MSNAVISASWEELPDMRPLWKHVLLTQAIYLLSEAKRKREAHETRNLNTVLDLLRKSDINGREKSSIGVALQRREDDQSKGIDLKPHEIAAWRAFVNCEESISEFKGAAK